MPTEVTPRRVVIIEDEGMVAMLLEDMLVELGHEVVAIASRMDRAFKLVSETSADIVFLDVNLNGEQTYSLADALVSRGVPFIFSTGYGAVGLKQEWKGTPLLQKPFRLEDLDRVMCQALSKLA